MLYVMVILEPWMQEEVKQYEEGRRKLAQLMNEDPESFSETQVTVCISQQTHIAVGVQIVSSRQYQ